MTKKELILQQALELLKDKPSGLRFSEIVRHIETTNPDLSRNTIVGTVVKDLTAAPNIVKPVPGLFILMGSDKTKLKKEEPAKVKIKEEDFYQPFADWIVNELEECTKAIPLGGRRFNDKWGTPDVIGIRKSKPSDIINFQTEIVSVEIKTNTNDLITAFGQSCSYKLFSHKSYIVIPKSSSTEDISRLDSLAMIFHIGLILFDATDPAKPDFEIRTRASKHEPDSFYVNRYMKYVEDELF